MDRLEIICTSRVINWSANHLVSEASNCSTRNESRSMSDSRCQPSNSRKPFLCFGIPIENSLGGGPDAERDSSGDLKYRKEDSETCTSARRSSKNVIMSTAGRRTAHVFYQPESPSIPSATCHISNVSHPISDLPRLVPFFGSANFSNGLRSPEDFLPGVRPTIPSSALDNQSDVLHRSTDYRLRTSSHCAGCRGA